QRPAPCRSPPGGPPRRAVAARLRGEPMARERAPRPGAPRRCRWASRGMRLRAAAVSGKRPEREEGAVAVVLEVEHPREPRSGGARMRPETVTLLHAQQKVDPTPHGR